MNHLKTQPSKRHMWLGGKLAQHRRGRILKDTVSAQSTEALPNESGILVLFGSDFQEGSDLTQKQWIQWSQEPGHVLLLIPPFKSKPCNVPKAWWAKRRPTAPSVLAMGNEFLTQLASEVQYELEGELQIAQSLGGQWDDQSLCTLYYRKHPHSGVFAITCLPLWSLIVLDSVDELQQWLTELSSLTVDVIAENERSLELPSFVPSQEHFIMMLHLLTSKFKSEESALEALKNSAIFSLDPTLAKQSLLDLKHEGFIKQLSLTEMGQQTLSRSPYAVYAKELEAIAR